MGRSPCCDIESGVKKGPWTSDEDEILSNFVAQNGLNGISWKALPKLAGLNRCGKSCRLRWTNYLRPDIKRGNFTLQEQSAIIELHSLLGNRWSKIASHFPGRTDNEIKNFWNTYLRKKLLQMGIDPNTHKPIGDLNQFTNLSQLFNGIASPLNNDHLKLQAEIAKLQVLQNLCQILNPTIIPQLPNTPIHGPQNPNPSPSQLLHVGFSTGLGLECGVGDENKAKMEMEGFDCQLPQLISEYPGSTSHVNQIGSELTNPLCCATKHSNSHSSSSIFDSLESLMNDEASGSSYWNDILRSTI